MKSIALAAALSVAASSVFAGSVSEPVFESMPQPIIETVQETNGSSAGSAGSASSNSSAGGLIVPLMALILIGAAIASSDD